MSSTTQPTSFSDLYTDLMQRTRNDTTQAATAALAKRAICTALYDMHIGFEDALPWAERAAQLLTQPSYSTGTVTIARGSTSLVGAGTLWATNNVYGVAAMRAGGKAQINGTNEVYEIESVASDTAATLTSRYVGSDASAGSYSYFEDEYALAADFLRPLDLGSFSDAMGIDLIGRREFRQRYPRNNVPGKPRVATILDKTFSGSTAPVRRVALHQPPDAGYLIPYAYVTGNLAVSAAGAAQANLVADSDEPIVPLRYRHAIVLHALYNWYRDRKNDSRSQEAKAEYTDIMLRIGSDGEIGRSRPQFRPRGPSAIINARSPYRRGRGGRHTLGASFDEVR